MERISIIGMGPIGTSIGLALKRASMPDTEIVGSSRDRDSLTAASKMGAVDSTTASLRSAMDGAQLVILDMPTTEIKDLLEVVGPVFDDGCIVTDTAPIKLSVLEWAEEYLPKGVDFIGGHPLPKKPVQGPDDADASLFEGAEYCVIPSKSAGQGSVSTVVNLVEKLGAKPLFLDPREHDSYAAAMTNLPLVLSSAFVTVTSGSSSWREMSRLAASEFAGYSSLAANDPADNEAACLANPEALVHWLDQMITELYSYRNQIKEQSEDLLEPFVRAWEARARWENDAVVDSAQPTLPTAGESMATALVGGRLVERYRQMTGGDKKQKQNWKYLGKR